MPEIIPAGAGPQKFNRLNLILEQWEIENGLPQNSIIDLARTRDGHLWIGTQEGVTSFDGIKFENYKSKPGWANQNIFTNVILASTDGSLWVGTRGGLNQIKNDRFIPFTLESGLPDTYISALAEDSSGAIWIGTRSGLAKLEQGRISTLTTKDGLVDNYIRTIAATSDGSIWVGTEKGISRIKDGRFKNLTEESGLSSNKITKVYERRDGSIWIGTEYGGSVKYKDGKLSRLRARDGLSNDSIFSIAEDHEGRLWLGTGAGVDCLEADRIINYSKNTPPLKDQIHSLLVDHEGILWIGTRINGLFKAITPKFTVYGKQEGLPGDDIWCVLESRDGSFWLGLGGGGGGLARMKDGRVQSWSTKDGLPDSEVLSLYETKDADLWVGTAGGLCQFGGGKFKCYTTKQGLIDDRVTAIAESGDGSLWIGTYKGISRFKNGVFDNSWNQNGLRGSLVSDLIATRDGSIWLVGLPGGAFRIKDGTIQNYSQAYGLPTDQTTSIYEDNAGDLWIGTYQNGLIRLRLDNKVTTYTTKQGLLEDQVFDTIEDGLGNFWLTSNHGIFRVEKRQFDDLDRGLIKQLAPIRYGTADGMRSEECNGGSQPSSWKTRNGKILITTIRGLVTFDPREIPNQTFTLQATVQKIVADRVAIPLNGTVELGPQLNDLEIHYSGWSLIAPTKIRFRYKLEDRDASWVYADDRRVAYYNDLPPGDYRFLVSVANTAGQWSEPTTGLLIHIKRHFYQTIWFYLLCTVICCLLLYVVYQTRVSRLNEKLLSKITLALPVSVSVIDTNNTVKLLNDQFVKEWGYTIEDMADFDRWFEQIYPDPALRHKARLTWNKATTEDSAHNDIYTLPREWHIRRKDGSEMDVEVRVAPVGDRFVVTFNDITYRKRAEEALIASNKRLKIEVEQSKSYTSLLPIFRAAYAINRENEAFIERSSIVEELLGQMLIVSGCPGIVLYGRRRMGKSTILRNLAGFLPTNVVTTFVSMQSPAMSVSLPSGLNTLQTEICLSFPPVSEVTISSANLSDFFNFLTKCNELLEAGGKRLLLALDEYETIDLKIGEGIFPADLLDTIRESIQTHDHITWVFAGSHEITELSNAAWTSYLVSAHTIEVPPFTSSETLLLLTDPLKHSKQWNDNEVERPRFAASFWGENGIERIHAEAGGWPHLVQLIAETIVDLVNLEEVSQVTPDLFERALDKSIVRGQNVLYELMHRESTLPGEWDYLLAFKKTETQPPPQDEKIVASLRRRLLITESNGKWRLRVPLMARWLKLRGQ